MSEAVATAALRLDISNEQLTQILDMTPATIAQMLSGERRLKEHSGEWERAQLFVRLLQSLQSLVSDDQTARAWINSVSQDLAGRPIELVARKEGLVKVVRYLEARRFRP